MKIPVTNRQDDLREERRFLQTHTGSWMVHSDPLHTAELHIFFVIILLIRVARFFPRRQVCEYDISLLSGDNELRAMVSCKVAWFIQCKWSKSWCSGVVCLCTVIDPPGAFITWCKIVAARRAHLQAHTGPTFIWVLSRGKLALLPAMGSFTM